MSSDNEDLDLVQEAEAEVEQVERDPDDANEGNDGEPSKNREVIKPRRVRNPQPKLNAERLKGPRGLLAMPELFMKQKFKGKGHEEQDLKLLLKTYEYWCHRLFPKYQFGECIEKLEKLGTNKAVVTNIKKIRMGILEVDEPIQKPESSEDEGDKEPTPENQFDLLVQAGSSQSGPSQAGPSQAPQLTEEQLETIRINKEKAMKLRQDRLRRIQQQVETKLTVSEKLPSHKENEGETSFSKAKKILSDTEESDDEENGMLARKRKLEKEISSDKKRVLSDTEESDEGNEMLRGKKLQKEISSDEKSSVSNSEESDEEIGMLGDTRKLEKQNLNDQKRVSSDTEDSNDGKNVMLQGKRKFGRKMSKYNKRVLSDSEESSDTKESSGEEDDEVSKDRKRLKIDEKEISTVKNLLDSDEFDGEKESFEEEEGGMGKGQAKIRDILKSKKRFLLDLEESDDEKENFESNMNYKEVENAVMKDKKVEEKKTKKRILSDSEESYDRTEHFVEGRNKLKIVSKEVSKTNNSILSEFEDSNDKREIFPNRKFGDNRDFAEEKSPISKDKKKFDKQQMFKKKRILSDSEESNDKTENFGDNEIVKDRKKLKIDAKEVSKTKNMILSESEDSNDKTEIFGENRKFTDNQDFEEEEVAISNGNKLKEKPITKSKKRILSDSEESIDNTESLEDKQNEILKGRKKLKMSVIFSDSEESNDKTENSILNTEFQDEGNKKLVVEETKISKSNKRIFSDSEESNDKLEASD